MANSRRVGGCPSAVAEPVAWHWQYRTEPVRVWIVLVERAAAVTWVREPAAQLEGTVGDLEVAFVLVR